MASAGASFTPSPTIATFLPPRLIAPHSRCLVSGKYFSRDLIDPDASGYRIGNRLGISRDHRHSNTKSMKSPDSFIGFGANLIFKGESAADLSHALRQPGWTLENDESFSASLKYEVGVVPRDFLNMEMNALGVL